MWAFIAIAFVGASGLAYTDPVEAWQCRDRFADNWKSILVTATVDSGRESGTIIVAGVTQEAAFGVEGFDRRWDFGPLPDGSYRYSFIIKPNGDAAYYDFRKESQAKPSNLMTCRQIDPAKAPN